MQAKDILIRELYEKFSEAGYISEDFVFDLVEKYNLSLVQVDEICDLLLSQGMIIHEGLGNELDENDIYDRSRTNYDDIFNEVILIEPLLKNLIDSIRAIKPPQHREFKNLISQSKNGNEFARNRIILMYLRTAVKFALQHSIQYKTCLSETIQEAFVGLVMAVEQYQIGKHGSFMSYASFWIRQTMYRELSIYSPLINYPFHIKEKALQIKKIIEVNRINYSDSKSLDQIIATVSKELALPVSEAEILLSQFDRVLSINSLDSAGYSLIDHEAEYALIDNISFSELKEAINKILERLTEKQLKVILLRYGYTNGKVYTLEQVGKRFGVSRERIRQIESQAIRILRSPKYARILHRFT